MGHLTPVDPAYQHALTATAGLLASQGSAGVQSMVQAQGLLYGLVQRQAAMMAFVDAFWIMAVASVLSIPLALLLKKVDPARAHAGVH